MNPPDAKAALRGEMKTRLAGLPPEDFSLAGKRTARRLRQDPRWEQYGSLLLFLSLKNEIDTRAVLEAAFAAGKKVFAPRIEFQDKEGGAARGDLVFHRIFPPGTGGSAWREGAFGIREPLPRPETRLQEGDFPALILSPGLAFDPQGGRLGRGGGYYDRFFAALDAGKTSASPGGSAAALPYTALGLCMEFQLVPLVPMGIRDKRMDAVFGG